MEIIEIISLLISSGMVIAFITLIYKMGQYKANVDNNFYRIACTLKSINEKIDRVEANLNEKIDKVAANLIARIDKIEIRFDKLTEKVDEILKSILILFITSESRKDFNEERMKSFRMVIDNIPIINSI